MINVQAKKKISFKLMRNLICTVGFLLIFCLLFVWVSYLVRPVDVYRETIAGFYAERNNTLDMVYIGGSSCFKYWMPLLAWDEYGFTSYNFATDAIPPQFVKYYIKEVLKTQTPELLIIDVRPFEFGDAMVDRGVMFMHREASLRRGTDSFNYSANRTEMIRRCVPESYNRTEYYFDIIMYHDNILSLTSDNFAFSLNRRSSDTKGYTFQTDIYQTEMNDYSDITEELPLSDMMFDLLVELIAYLDSLDDINVLFIVPPYSLANEGEQMLHNYMGRIIGELGYDFLDCNNYYDEIGLDSTVDLFDRNHVNVTGAVKYTGFLAAYLSDNYTFEDKSDNPAYQSWHRDFEAFATLIP